MTLERQDFQKLLFRIAFCIMICDGDIDDREVNEIKKMNQSLAYFQGIDISGELEELLADLKTKGKYIVDELFDTFANIDASIIQELLILEVSFRMIYADGRVDENEIKFLRFLRSHLKLHDETIRDRFGVVEYLFDMDYSQDIIKKEVCNDLFESFIIPKAKEIQAIDFG